jgi:hypothetical protein
MNMLENYTGNQDIFAGVLTMGDRDISRLQQFLDDLKIQHKPIDAVYVDKNIKYINHNTHFNGSHLLSAEEVSCRLGHAKILRANTSRLVLALEDDVIIPDDLDKKDFLCNVRTVSDDEVLILGGQQGLKLAQYFQFRSKYFPYDKLFQSEVKRIYRTCCYVVTRNTANKLSSLFCSKEYAVADDWYHNASKLTLRIRFKAFLRHPTNGTSNIEGNRHGKM